MVERQNSYFNSNQDEYIRIHEKAKLDHKSEELGIILLTGAHVDRQGNVVTDMNAPHEIFEEVKGVLFSIGAKCDESFSRIIHILAQSYKTKYAKVELEQVEPDTFTIDSTVNMPTRNEEPYRVRKYQQNHKILNEEWERKKIDEIEEESEDFVKGFKDQKPWNSIFVENQKSEKPEAGTDKFLCLYNVKDPVENLAFDKQEEEK